MYALSGKKKVQKMSHGRYLFKRYYLDANMYTSDAEMYR